MPEKLRNRAHPSMRHWDRTALAAIKRSILAQESVRAVSSAEMAPHDNQRDAAVLEQVDTVPACSRTARMKML